MDISTNRQLVQRFFAQLERRLRGEPADLAALFHEDIRWHFPQSSATLGTPSDNLGKPAVMAIFQDSVAQYYKPDSIRFTYHAITAEADRVHVHFSMQAITANDKPYHNHYQSLFQLRDGQILEVWEYFDTAYVISLFQA